MPTVTETQDIGSSSVKWNIVYAKGFNGPLSGNATTASYPEGFSGRTANFSWGNSTGTAVTSWNDSTGGSVGFRRDNPSGGKLSLLVDGRVYVSEGAYPVAAMRSLNGYWGMTNPDGTDNVWIRTTSQGLLPYQAAGPTDTAVGSLGTSTWYFKDAYIQNIYGNLTGVASKATAANITSTQYGVAYYSDAAGTFASTAAGTGGTALVGTTSGAPQFTAISTTLTHTAGTGSSPSQLKVTVLGSESTTITLTTASTSVYGMTKLSSTSDSSAEGVAATPKGVWAAINTLDVAEQTASGTSITFIAELKQVDGKIVNKKMTVRDASDSQSGVVNTEAQVFAGDKSFLGATTFNNNTTTTGVATFNGNVMMNSSASADSLTAGSLVVSGNTSLVNTTSTSTILPHSNNTVNIGASGNKYATIYATTFEGVADKAKKSNGGSSTNAIAYFTDGSGTFGYISSGAGALYASSAGGKPTFGTLPVALGGTEKTSWTKFALVYASNTTVLDSLGVGTAGQILKTNGSSSAPEWVNQSSLTVGKATAANLTTTKYGVAYYSDTGGTFATTGQGTSAQALVGGGSTGGPTFTAISPALSQSSDGNGKLTLNVSVLNNSGTEITLTTATTSLYGVTLLANSFTTGTTRNTSTTTAAHPNAIWNAIDSLDASDPTASGEALQFIATISEANGIIDAKKRTVQNASASQAGVVNTDAQTFAGDKTFNGAVAVNNNISATGTLTITGNAYLQSSTDADSLSAGSLLVRGNTSLVNTTNTSTLLPHSNNTVDIGASGNKYATIYATTFDGVATKAAAANITSSTYGIAYYSNTTGTFASTEQGGSNTVLMGKGNAVPGFVGIYSQLTLTDGTSSTAPKLDVSVLGVTTSNKTVTLTKATTGVYGVTKLSSTSSTTEEGLAATPKGVWAAIGTLDYNDSSATTTTDQIQFVSQVTETDGKISVVKANVRDASATQSGVVSTGEQGFAGDKTFNGNVTTTGTLTVNGNTALNASVNADSLQAGSLLVSGNTSLVNVANTSTLLPHSNNTVNIGASGNKYATVYATAFDGVATKATSANITNALYGVAYYSDTTGKFASTEQGAANTVFMGKGAAAPGFVSVSSKLTINDRQSNAGQTISVTVLDVAGTASVTLGTATTGVYGVTKLSSTSSTSEEGLAATPKGVWAAIGTLDYNSPSTGTDPAIEFITLVSETDGKISAEKQAVREASTTQSGIVSTGTQGFIGDKTFNSALTVTGVATFNGNVAMNSSVSADSLSAGSLIVSGNTSLVNTTTTSTLLPHTNNTYNIGASGNKYLDVYATTFHGGVDGNANTSTGWFTAATITIGNKSNTLQSGGQSISYSLNDIGFTAAGSEKHPVYISSTGVPVACNSSTATTIQQLEAISSQGAIGLYSNGTGTVGLYNVDTSGTSHYFLRFTVTSTSPQATWYCTNNFRSSVYLWNSNASKTSEYIYGYRSAGTSGSTTGTGNYDVWGGGTIGWMYLYGGYKRTAYTDGVAGTVTYYNTNWYFYQKSMNSSDGTFNSYYDYYYLPGTEADKTSNNGYQILTTRYLVSVWNGGTGKGSWNAGQLVYSSGTQTLANTTNISTDGYTIDISGTYYPQFTLTATSTNNSSTYSRAAFQGDYSDNVAMWIYSDKTTTSSSRRGLVLKGYAGQADDDLALVYRRCNTSGTWQSDQYILTSGNWSNYITIPSVENCTRSTYTDYLSNASHSVTLSKSTWTGTNSWSYTSGQVVWGQRGIVSSVSSDSADITLSYGVHSSAGGAGWFVAIDGGVYSLAGIWSAVWNDFAEYRTSNESEPGRVIIPQANGVAIRSTERLQAGARIISDTYGHSIGYCNEAQTPVGVSGRVLAYPYQDPANYKVGDAVCAAPNGTVDVMSREEIMMYPDRIIGIINEIPKYDKWHRTVNCGDDKQPKTFDIEVKGRIWIDIK